MIKQSAFSPRKGPGAHLLTEAEVRERSIAGAASARHRAETAPSIRQGSTGAPSRQAVALFRQGQARPDTRSRHGPWDTRSTDHAVGGVQASFTFHFPKVYRSKTPDPSLPGRSLLVQALAPRKRNTVARNLVVTNPSVVAEAQRHPAMREIITKTIGVVQDHQEGAIARGHEVQRRTGKPLIPEGTHPALVARAYKHAALIALHKAGLGDYDFRMDEATKAQLRPLVPFMRYAHRRVFDKLNVENKGKWDAFREEFGTEYRQRKFGKETGHVRMRMRDNQEFIKIDLGDLEDEALEKVSLAGIGRGLRIGLQHAGDLIRRPTAVGKKPSFPQIKRDLFRANATGRERLIITDAGGHVTHRTTGKLFTNKVTMPIKRFSEHQGANTFHNHPLKVGDHEVGASTPDFHFAQALGSTAARPHTILTPHNRAITRYHEGPFDVKAILAGRDDRTMRTRFVRSPNLKKALSTTGKGVAHQHLSGQKKNKSGRHTLSPVELGIIALTRATAAHRAGIGSEAARGLPHVPMADEGLPPSHAFAPGLHIKHAAMAIERHYGVPRIGGAASAPRDAPREARHGALGKAFWNESQHTRDHSANHGGEFSTQRPAQLISGAAGRLQDSGAAALKKSDFSFMLGSPGLNLGNYNTSPSAQLHRAMHPRMRRHTLRIRLNTQKHLRHVLSGGITRPERWQLGASTSVPRDPFSFGKRSPIDDHAAAAATPTPAQAKAGNYRMGHTTVGGLRVSIETPKGRLRTGTGPTGRRWSVRMPAHYGYVKKTMGADGDHIDVYLGSHAHEAEKHPVFVVDQQDANTHRFDEHKAMLGFRDLDHATSTYDKAFSDKRGPERRRAVHQVTLDDFKHWVANGDTTKAFGRTKVTKSLTKLTKPLESGTEIRIGLTKAVPFGLHALRALSAHEIHKVANRRLWTAQGKSPPVRPVDEDAVNAANMVSHDDLLREFGRRRQGTKKTNPDFKTYKQATAKLHLAGQLETAGSSLGKGIIASALEAGRRYGTAIGARAAGSAERIAGRVAAHPRVAPILARPRVAAGLRQVRAAGWKGALDPSHTAGRAAGAAIGGHRGAKIGGQVGSVASYVPQAVSLGGAAAAGLGIGRETASSDPNKPRKLRKAAPRGRSIYTAPLKQTLREHLRIIAGGTPSPHHLSAIAQGRRAHMDAAQAHIPAALAAIAGAARITGALHA